jgi:hypothetical protein
LNNSANLPENERTQWNPDPAIRPVTVDLDLPADMQQLLEDHLWCR